MDIYMKSAEWKPESIGSLAKLGVEKGSFKSSCRRYV